MGIMVRIINLMGIMVFLSGMLLAGQSIVHAAPEDWQTPQWIPGLIDTDPNQYPYFITDPSGKLHVFHSQWVGERLSIVYSSWNEGIGWPNPVDILLSPSGEARIVGAFLDNSGMMNIFFWGGNDQGAAIYFTEAPVETVGSSKAWTQPIIVGAHAIAPATAAVVSDAQGSIVLVYSGNEEGNGLYSVTSQDGGTTWTRPAAFYFATSDFLWPSALQMMLDSNGTVHAVWGLGDETGNSRSVYHAALGSESSSWSSPVILANAITFEADTPNIIEHDGVLMIVYHNDFPTTRWMIRSTDGGNSWTAPTRLFKHVGSNGYAAFAKDSSGMLHMFFGNRIGSIHGLWHSQWINDTWSVPEPIVSGPQIQVGPNGEEGFDPSTAQALVLRGNLLFVVWRHDPMAGPQRIWYTYKVLNTPELNTVGLATPVITSTFEAAEAAAIIETPRAAPTLNPTLSQEVIDDSDMGNFPLIMLASVVPVFLLVIATLVIQSRRK